MLHCITTLQNKLNMRATGYKTYASFRNVIIYTAILFECKVVAVYCFGLDDI